MDKNVLWFIVFITFAILASGLYIYSDQTSKTIEVTGESVIKTKPDLLGIYVNIETNGKTANEAENKNSEISDKIEMNLKKLGFTDADIETTGFNIYEDYEWNSGKRVSKGYKASNQIKVKIKDFTKAGDVIDAVANNGGLINGINFELDEIKQQEYKQQAMSKAAEDTMNKANAIAKGVNMKVGKLVSIQVNDYNFYPYQVYARAEGMFSASDAKIQVNQANINPGDLEISARVMAIYKLH